MMKIAVIGATGPTGIHLVTELRKTIASVRVIARSTDRLARPETAVEKWPADVLDADATLCAIEGCDLVYDCIGLPGDQMHLHPVTARNIAGAVHRTKARCVQVSSYWAYYPQVWTEMNESHPRIGGPPWVRYRREAEDVLSEAGAAILHLPDFYGARVHVSTLQNALNEAASGKTVNWLGRTDVQREYVYVPDAMRIAVEIGARTEALGEHWCLPGSGPLSGRQVADIAGHHLGRQVKLRSAGMTTLRIVGVFNKDLRGLLQVAPDYMKPVRYDTRKLQGLLGPQQMTSYDAGIGHTLAWMALRHTQPRADAARTVLIEHATADTLHCRAPLGKISWRKILPGRSVPWPHRMCSPVLVVITPANKAVSPACFGALPTTPTGNAR